MIKVEEEAEETKAFNFYEEWEVNSFCPCQLYVRNKQDDYIATLKGIGSAWWPESLIITSYCRDPAILAYDINNIHSSLSSSSSSLPSSSFYQQITGSRMQCFDQGSKPNLAGFSKYLKDRGKAACAEDMIKFVSYFIVPSSRANEVILLRRPMRRKLIIPSSQPKQAGTTNKVMTMQQQLEAFRQKTKQRLLDFINSEDEDSLAFEPMTDRGRDVVMGEVSEFPELVDKIEGDLIDEKHVVVHKRDRMATEVSVSYQDIMRAKQSGVVQKRPPPPTDAPAPADLVHMNGKRDRRTASDIIKETELKRKKASED